MNDTLNILKALSDETRMKIINLMSEKPICAKGIAKYLNISEAAVSQHIKLLKDVNLIEGYKIGYHIIYDLNYNTLKLLKSYLNSLLDYNGINSLDEPICLKECKHRKCCEPIKNKEEVFMKICFPVKSNEGLKSVPYGHFGSAPLFVIYDLKTNEVKPINNGDLNHEHGKCQPIKALCNIDVDAVIVGGIGQGAIMKLNSMGVKVYEALQGTIEDNINAYKNNKLMEFSSNHICHHDHCEGHK